MLSMYSKLYFSIYSKLGHIWETDYVPFNQHQDAFIVKMHRRQRGSVLLVGKRCLIVRLHFNSEIMIEKVNFGEQSPTCNARGRLCMPHWMPPAALCWKEMSP